MVLSNFHEFKNCPCVEKHIACWKFMYCCQRYLIWRNNDVSALRAEKMLPKQTKTWKDLSDFKKITMRYFKGFLAKQWTLSGNTYHKCFFFFFWKNNIWGGFKRTTLRLSRTKSEPVLGAGGITSGIRKSLTNHSSSVLKSCNNKHNNFTIISMVIFLSFKTIFN